MIELHPKGFYTILEDQWISRWARESNRLDHDQNILPVLRPFIRPGDTVVDCGAAIGDHTIAYLEWVGPKGKVIAIEPGDEAFLCLEKNCPTAELHKCAVGESETILEYVPSGLNYGAAFLRKPEKGAKDLVYVKSLDKLLNWQRVDFVKLDIEGGELGALKGCESIINRWHPIIFAEINKGALERNGTSSAEVLGWLDKHDYTWEIYPPYSKLEDLQYDCLCLPKK